MAEPEHMRQNGMNRAAQDGGHVLGSAAPVACEMDVAVSLPFLVDDSCRQTHLPVNNNR
jgi:hypothetical protein